MVYVKCKKQNQRTNEEEQEPGASENQACGATFICVSLICDISDAKLLSALPGTLSNTVDRDRNPPAVCMCCGRGMPHQLKVCLN